VTVLLVDAANVIGSVPDGWWRDRAGAAGRLVDGLARLPGQVLPGPDGTDLRCDGVVAVLEGRARDVPAPPVPGLRIVRAPGSGDDALAATAAELVAAGGTVLAVTADRGLRSRLPRGVAVTGPGWLNDRLGRVAGR
jgi:hypothetical protein